MDTTQQQAKPKRGLKKLWAKVKASIRSKSGSATTPSTTTTPSTQPQAAQESTTTSQVPPTTLQEPTTQIPSQPAAEVSQTQAQTTPASPSEPTRKDIAPPIQIIGIIEVDDGDDGDEALVPTAFISSPSTSDKARFDRARAIFEKYNLKLEPSDWHTQTKTTFQRVENKPRMRVRWTCHACEATFGRDKTCAKCAHKRCSKCVRYPPKRTGERAKKDTPGKPVVPEVPTDLPTTGACHECKTDFEIGAPKCANCDHQICERCLKETILASPSTAPPIPRSTIFAST